MTKAANGGQANTSPSLIIKIADFLRKVNTVDADFAKYFPTQFFEVPSRVSSTDSTGRELSEGQKAYFADSKVRDEDGRLKVMYRGGNDEFTVFDR